MVLLPDPATQNPQHRLLIWNTAPDLGDDFEVWMISSQPGDPWHKFNRAMRVTENLGTTNIFCAGHAFHWDSSLILSGGHLGSDQGIKDVFRFTENPDRFNKVGDMWQSRWYPTNVQLPDRRFLFVGGTYLDGGTVRVNAKPSLWMNGFPGGTSYEQGLTPATLGTNGYYPFVFVDPSDGNLFYTANGTGDPNDPEFIGNKKLNLATLQWEDFTVRPAGVANVKRTYPSAAMLTMLVGGQEKTLVVKCGGAQLLDNDDTPDKWAKKTTLYVYLSDGANAQWQQGPDLVYERKNHTLVVLPTRQVLAMGGNIQGRFGPTDDPRTAPEIWDAANPAAGWGILAQPSIGTSRGYHSTPSLLPDARVIIAGSEPVGDPQRKAQIFSPPYAGTNNWEPLRPTIATLDDSSLRYGQQFQVTVTAHASYPVQRFVLISPGATTHAFNQNQRFVELAYTYNSGTGVYTITAPAAPRKAVEGPYMLFAIGVDSTGKSVPSVARIVSLQDGYDRFHVVSGQLNLGTYQSFQEPPYKENLFLADNVWLGGAMLSGLAPHRIDLTLNANAPRGSAQDMRLTLEGAIPTAGTSVTMETKLWNWSSGGYVVVDTRTLSGSSDQRFEIELRDNLLPEHPYIRQSDPLDGFGPWLVRAQITWRLPDPNQIFAIKLDSVEMGVRD